MLLFSNYLVYRDFKRSGSLAVSRRLKDRKPSKPIEVRSCASVHSEVLIQVDEVRILAVGVVLITSAVVLFSIVVIDICRVTILTWPSS